MQKRAFNTQCLPCTDDAVRTSEFLLKEGEVIGVPTETVYGLCADATNGAAIEKIYWAKGRPSSNPLIVHVGSELASCQKLAAQGLLDIDKMSEKACELADKLMQTFWPGPLTIVLPRGLRLSPLVARDLETVGFRMPCHPAFLKLLDQSGLALAAPSANLSNRISPTTAQHVLNELGGRIPLILDGGTCQFGLESTIVEIDPSSDKATSVRLLRHGAVASEVVQATLGISLAPIPDRTNLLAPGMMREHYSPTKPLFVLTEDELSTELKSIRESGFLGKVAVLKFSDDPSSLLQTKWQLEVSSLELICLPCDDRSVAKALFQTLRLFDESDARILLVERPRQPLQQGIWPAIWDRLSRAGARWHGQNLLEIVKNISG